MTNLSDSAASGVKWLGMSSVLRAALRFAQVGLLARLLEQEDFGQVALVSATVMLVALVGDLGLVNAVVYARDLGRDRLSSVFCAQVSFGVLAFVVLVLVAPLLARVYDEPDLVELTRLEAVTVLIAPFGMVFTALLQKELRFGPIALAELGGALAGTSLAVGAAVAGLGARAIVVGHVATTVATTVVFALAGRRLFRPRLRLRSADFVGMRAFGGYQMGQRVLEQLIRRADAFMIGFFCGTQLLGTYSIAVNVVNQLKTLLMPAINRVTFPIYTKMQGDDNRMRRAHLQVTEMAVFVSSPVFFGLAAVAVPFVSLYLGAEWMDSAEVLQAVALFGLFTSMNSPVGPLLLAKGRANLGFWSNGLVLTATIVGIYVGSRWSMAGIIAAIYVVWLGVVLPAGMWMRWFVVRVKPLDYLRAIHPGVLLGAGMTACVIGVEALFTLTFGAEHSTLRDIALLTTLVLAGAASYALLVALFRRETGLELIDLFRRSRRDQPVNARFTR